MRTEQQQISLPIWQRTAHSLPSGPGLISVSMNMKQIRMKQSSLCPLQARLKSKAKQTQSALLS